MLESDFATTARHTRRIGWVFTVAAAILLLAACADTPSNVNDVVVGEISLTTASQAAMSKGVHYPVVESAKLFVVQFSTSHDLSVISRSMDTGPVVEIAECGYESSRHLAGGEPVFDGDIDVRRLPSESLGRTQTRRTYSFLFLVNNVTLVEAAERSGGKKLVAHDFMAEVVDVCFRLFSSRGKIDVFRSPVFRVEAEKLRVALARR